jgi:glycosyltransferase involved in cell wall biosynthesis
MVTKPVVLVDGTSLNRRMKGVGRYAWQIISELQRRLGDKVALTVVAFEGELPDFPEGFEATWIRIPYHSELSLGLVQLPRLLRRSEAAVFIRPADKIGRRYRCPTLTVCHDINPLIWAAGKPLPLRRRVLEKVWEFWRGLALRRSDRVVCNSKFVRDAAVAHFGIDPGRTTIGYCGVDSRIPALAGQADREGLRRRFGGQGFLLAFATGDPREGAEILPPLWAACKQAGYRGSLVLAGVNGSAPYAEELASGFDRLGVNDSVNILPFLGEAELGLLAGLYGSCDYYLETSRHEGFGMQLVEAMACGATCFSSGRGALAEVGGGFPIRLAIDDPPRAGRDVAQAWAAKVHLRDKGDQVAHALGFDWSDACDAVCDFVTQEISR